MNREEDTIDADTAPAISISPLPIISLVTYKSCPIFASNVILASPN
jgi:hypothetical protein